MHITHFTQKKCSLWDQPLICAAFIVAGLVLCFGLALRPASAQTGGQGAIQGTVTDTSGAVVSGATITATNDATGVKTVRTSTSAGVFNISPLPPGKYKVEVSSTGFKTLVQDNLAVDALGVRAFNPVLAIGSAEQTITVTAAPPALETANATISTTMENETYSNLPLQMNGAQRDPTAFGALVPGAQGGTRLPVIGGTGNYLGQLYLDGMPAETVNQQGDNRLVSQALSVDAVDQFQVVTSTPPAEYMGAGAENFTMKSGGNKFHGQASDFIRNTVFDAWSFTNKHATVKNAQGETVPAPKPPEHQNELSLSLGGPIPHTANKLFFFVAYDKYHERIVANPVLYTLPTDLMRKGDFTELNGNVGSGGEVGTGSNNPAIIYNPLTNNCSGSSCTRQPFMGIKNGVPTYNVIPDNMISPIAKAMEQFLPEPTNPNVLVNNYLAGMPRGFDNHLVDYRVDFQLNDRHRISTVGAMGDVNYLNNFGTGGSGSTSYGYLPLPYTGGDYANIFPKNFIVEDVYTLNSNLVNQFKFSYTRFLQVIKNATQGVAQFSPTKMGITNLPLGQAGEEFPGAAFGTTSKFGTPLTGWTQNGNSASTQITTPNNYALTDNVQWLKGKHAFTFGITYQWEEINNANPATYTGILSVPYNAFSTANFSGNTLSSSSGYAFASYLLGAVAGSTGNNTSAPQLGLQPVSELGGRYHPFAPYFEDTYKITPSLTINYGLRWDYLPPFHEVKNRWTFLNPNLTNAITGTKGMLQFAGNYGGAGVSCQCTTPVHTYWNNWGPRLGIAWSINSKTVIRAGAAQVFTQAGGVGGRGGAANGTGQLGFNVTAIGPTEVGTGANAGPSYYLNTSDYFKSVALDNSDLFGKGFNYPTPPAPGVDAQTLNTGYYLDSSGKFKSAGSVSYADPYLAGRAPELEMWNFGVERGITNNLTLAVNYVGNQSHFIVNSGTTGSNARGYWANQLDPKYLALLGPLTDSTGKTPLLDAPATPANVAILHSVAPDAPAPTFYQNAAAKSSSATIAHMLVAFPQYSGVSDTWGNVGNFSYHSLQVSLDKRMSNGLSFTVNYTLSKNIGDDGGFRSGFPIPAAAISHGTRSWKQDRIERSETELSMRHNLHAFGVYQLPFGKGHIGSDSRLVRWAAGGWQLSGIYSYASGTPVSITSSACSGTTYPGQGTCMPDINTSFSGSARINGKYGSGPNGTQFSNLGSVSYFDSNAFATPQNVSTIKTAQYLIGNAPRTAPWGLRNPTRWGLDAGLRRTFPIRENLQFIFEADCLNALNHVDFSNPNASWGSAAFGTISGISNSPRDFQFAGHLRF